MKYKLITLFLSFTLILSLAPAAFGASFSGYSQWAYAELTEAEEYGLITDSIREQMNAPITREEFAELAVRLVEVYTGKTPVTAPKETFSDTTNEYVLKAYTCGIVNGVGKGRFEPKSLTNREQVATMLGRTMQLIAPEMDTSYSNETSFLDEDQVAEYFLPYVKFMSQKELVKGSSGQFRPKDNCTREQAVLIVKRVYEYLVLSQQDVELPDKGEADSFIIGKWSTHDHIWDNVDYNTGGFVSSEYYLLGFSFNEDGTFLRILITSMGMSRATGNYRFVEGETEWENGRKILLYNQKYEFFDPNATIPKGRGYCEDEEYEVRYKAEDDTLIIDYLGYNSLKKLKG